MPPLGVPLGRFLGLVWGDPQNPKNAKNIEKNQKIIKKNKKYSNPLEPAQNPGFDYFLIIL